MSAPTTETAGSLTWLLMATHVPPSGQGGGIVRYTTELARSLEARDDVELHVLADAEAASWWQGWLPAGRVHRAPRLPRVAMALLERVGGRLALRGEVFDVVQGTKHLLPLRAAGTTVLTVHDMLLLDRPLDFDGVKRRLLRRPYLSSLRQADVLAVVSAATAARVRAWVPSAAERMTVVPLATSPALLSAEAKPVAELAGATFALVVGDPSPRKNLPLVVDSWHEVVERVPGAVLVVVGPDSWGETSHGAAFERLRAQGRLLRLTDVTDGRLRWCYENARAVLCPSLAEGFGLPAVEALDLGAPLITSHDAALVEASRGRALHLPADDARAWVDAVSQVLEVPRQAGGAVTARAPRGWDDVVEETVRAVRARDAQVRPRWRAGGANPG